MTAEKERKNEHKISSAMHPKCRKERLRTISRMVERWNRHGSRWFSERAGTSAAEIKKQIADDRDETRRRLIIEYNNVRIVMPIVEVIVLVLSVVFLKRQD